MNGRFQLSSSPIFCDMWQMQLQFEIIPFFLCMCDVHKQNGLTVLHIATWINFIHFAMLWQNGIRALEFKKLLFVFKFVSKSLYSTKICLLKFLLNCFVLVSFDNENISTQANRYKL